MLATTKKTSYHTYLPVTSSPGKLLHDICNSLHVVFYLGLCSSPLRGLKSILPQVPSLPIKPLPLSIRAHLPSSCNFPFEQLLIRTKLPERLCYNGDPRSGERGGVRNIGARRIVVLERSSQGPEYEQ